MEELKLEMSTDQLLEAMEICFKGYPLKSECSKCMLKDRADCCAYLRAQSFEAVKKLKQMEADAIQPRHLRLLI